jgi:hypothetical protein
MYNITQTHQKCKKKSRVYSAYSCVPYISSLALMTATISCSAMSFEKKTEYTQLNSHIRERYSTLTTAKNTKNNIQMQTKIPYTKSTERENITKDTTTQKYEQRPIFSQNYAKKNEQPKPNTNRNTQYNTVQRIHSQSQKQTTTEQNLQDKTQTDSQIAGLDKNLFYLITGLGIIGGLSTISKYEYEAVMRGIKEVSYTALNKIGGTCFEIYSAREECIEQLKIKMAEYQNLLRSYMGTNNQRQNQERNQRQNQERNQRQQGIQQNMYIIQNRQETPQDIRDTTPPPITNTAGNQANTIFNSDLY